MDNYKPNLISGTCAALAGVCAKLTFNFAEDEPFGRFRIVLKVLLHLSFLVLFILANAVML